MAYNWEDIQGPTGPSRGYEDVLCDEYSFATFAQVRQGIPSVTFTIYDKKKDDKPAFIEKSKKILIDYINSLYSIQPKYNETDDTLLEKYNDLFVHKKANARPLCIWITPKSKIALIKHAEYELYAEPN